MRSGGGSARANGVPAITSSISAASATVVASGPFSSSPPQLSAPIWAGTTPGPGLRPNRPQTAAGMRTEPSPSVPCAIGTIADATAAADPPGRPARRAASVPRIAGDPERTVGERVDRHLGQVGQPHHHRAGLAEPGHDRVILLLRRAGRCRAAQPHRLPGHRDDILDRDRDPGQRQLGPVGPGVDLRGFLGRLSGPDPHERAQLRVELGDTVQVRGDHLHRGDRSRPDRGRGLGSRAAHPARHAQPARAS